MQQFPAIPPFRLNIGQSRTKGIHPQKLYCAQAACEHEFKPISIAILLSETGCKSIQAWDPKRRKARSHHSQANPCHCSSHLHMQCHHHPASKDTSAALFEESHHCQHRLSISSADWTWRVSAFHICHSTPWWGRRQGHTLVYCTHHRLEAVGFPSQRNSTPGIVRTASWGTSS